MKKIQIIILLATMSFVLCACGKETTKARKIAENNTEQETQSEMTEEISVAEESSTENQKAGKNEQETITQEQAKNTVCVCFFHALKITTSFREL